MPHLGKINLPWHPPRMSEALEAVTPEAATRAQIKEACRLAYITGTAKLTELAVRHLVPYETLARWSKEADWKTQKAALTVPAQQSTDELGKWLQDEREKQVRRAVARAGKLQAAIDRVLAPEGELVTLSAKELAAIGTAEEKADSIARRNLGMEDRGASSVPAVNVNVLGSVQIVE